MRHCPRFVASRTAFFEVFPPPYGEDPGGSVYRVAAPRGVRRFTDTSLRRRKNSLAVDCAQGGLGRPAHVAGVTCAERLTGPPGSNLPKTYMGGSPACGLGGRQPLRSWRYVPSLSFPTAPTPHESRVRSRQFDSQSDPGLASFARNRQGVNIAQLVEQQVREGQSEERIERGGKVRRSRDLELTPRLRRGSWSKPLPITTWWTAQVGRFLRSG